MKKLLLLLVSGLLIACMAGSAMADSIVLEDPNVDSAALQYAIGSTNYLNVKFVDLTFGPTFMYSASPLAKIKVPGGTWRVANSDEVKVEFDRNPATFTPTAADYVDERVVKVIIGNVPEGSEIVASVSADNMFDPITITAVKRSTVIPEFPTVALPVAAILGLVFIFGRKKDGL
jgi:hypothetical protein